MKASKALQAGVLFVLAAGLLIYIGVYERGEAPAKGQIWRHIPIDQAEAIEVKKGDDTLRLEKRGKEWWLVKPFEALASEDAARRMVEAVARAKYTNRYEQWDSTKKEYGFEEPELVAVLTYAGGKQARITVGADTPVGGERFATTDKDGALYTVSSSVKTDLDKTATDLREKKLARFESDDVQRVTLTYNGKELVFVPKTQEQEKQWQLVKPIEALGDKWSIDSIVNKLRDLEAKEFVEGKPKADKAYGFDKPQLVAKVELKEREPVIIEFGRKVEESSAKPTPGPTPTPTPTWNTSSTERVYARAKGRNEVMMVDASVLTDLRKEPKDLRDKTVCKFERDDLKEISIERRDGPKIVLKKGEKQGEGEATWSIISPKAAEAEQSKVDSLIWSFTDLKAAEFVTEKATQKDLETYGLDRPVVTVTFKLAKETISVLFGKEKEKDSLKYYYAKVSNKAQVVLVNEYVYKDIPQKLDDVRKPEPTPTPTAAATPTPTPTATPTPKK